MTGTEPFLKTLTIIAFVVAVPVAIVSFFRIFFAKTRRDYWKRIGLFVAPIMLVLFLTYLSGSLIFFPPRPEAPAPSTPPISPFSMLGKLPGLQLLLLSLGAVTWLFGGNILFWMHKRRIGKPWWQMMNPLDPPFRYFNSKEWSIFGLLFFLSFLILILALAIDSQ